MTDATLDEFGNFKAAPGTITTATGKRVDPQALHPEDIDIHDIARSLSRQCRYNGHVGGFLSVARHSLWVSMSLPPHLQLAGLLHDAAEAYLGDVVRPLKHSPFGKHYLEMEEKAERVIFQRFGIPYPLADEIKEADTDTLIGMEMGTDNAGGARWDWNSTPAEDEAEFLALYARLTTAVPEPRLIGLMGYAQSGKDTVAAFMVNEQGFTRRAFADPLREALYALNPQVQYNDQRTRTDSVAYVVNTHGWEWAKANTEIRALLQRMGMEVGRNLFGPNVWVDIAVRDLPPRCVFTDVRFRNEAEAIRERGGELWRVKRNGCGPVNDHPSETALDNVYADAIIHNNGTLADLAKAVDHLVGLGLR